MNQKYPHPILAREGWPYIGGTFLLALLWTALAGFGFVAALLWIFFIIVTQFFRDPPRTVPAMPEAVLSPADGQIVKVEKTIDPFTNEEAILISVFMNIFNVHCQRFPVNGTVEDVQYYPGKFLNADLDKASTENERNAVIVRVNDGNRITVVQVAGLVARRILCYIQRVINYLRVNDTALSVSAAAWMCICPRMQRLASPSVKRYLEPKLFWPNWLLKLN